MSFYYKTLMKKISKREATIAVVGLGYVGLPVLIQFYRKGFKCIGIDIVKKKIESFFKYKFDKKFFRPILRNKKKDLTQSCFDGIRRSKFENILVMDGDLQHDPKYIKKMFKIYKKFNLDIVIGSRKLLSGKNQGLSELRRFTSIILIYFFRIFKIKTNDPMSGFFIFKKKYFILNKRNVYSKGFKILLNLLYSTKKTMKIYDQTIVFEKRFNNKSKMNYKVLYHIIISIFYYFYLNFIK